MNASPSVAAGQEGRADFDFFFGRWQIRNRKLRDPLEEGCDEWLEFEAFGEAWPILGGLGNVDTYKAPEFPGRPGFEGATLRLFEPATGLWRIWWMSTTAAGILDDNPVVGRFVDGIGIFECDQDFDGRMARVRYTWTADPSTPRWEQSFSWDGGATWEPNWVMTNTRLP
jgi:hypothetical protein